MELFDCREFLKGMFFAIKTHKAFICIIIFYRSLMDSGIFLPLCRWFLQGFSLKTMNILTVPDEKMSEKNLPLYGFVSKLMRVSKDQN